MGDLPTVFTFYCVEKENEGLYSHCNHSSPPCSSAGH
uniref:Uncharacterized protein n=1 Tax=Anguilla anguilla TaxID=7936 RepID=A0A0E9SKR8_ANGAN